MPSRVRPDRVLPQDLGELMISNEARPAKEVVDREPVALRAHVLDLEERELRGGRRVEAAALAHRPVVRAEPLARADLGGPAPPGGGRQLLKKIGRGRPC